MKKTPFLVRVPATTANLGAGFDVLGVCLHLFNSFRVFPEGTKPLIITTGTRGVPTDGRNIFFLAYNAVFRKAGAKPIPVRVEAKAEIPLARGLGSSAATYLAGAVAAQHLLGYPLHSQELMEVVVGLEGHPDNIVPAFSGGMAVTVKDGHTFRYFHHHVHGLRAVVAIPGFRRSTAALRRAVPQRCTLEAAVYNLGRTALFVGAVIDKQYENLRYAMQDALHQRYRAKRIPGMNAVIAAALNAGAYGCALSGSGPTMLALADDRFATIATAMKRAFNRHQVECAVRVVEIDNGGVQVRE